MEEGRGEGGDKVPGGEGTRRVWWKGKSSGKKKVQKTIPLWEAEGIEK